MGTKAIFKMARKKNRAVDFSHSALGGSTWFPARRQGQYALDFRIIDGDVGRPHNSFHTEPLPHGCLCVYASQPGLEYIRESLEKTLLANLEQEDRLPFHGLPLVMVFAGQEDFLREEGINRAKNLQCPFVDDGGGLDPVRLEQALCALVESIERWAGLLHIYQALPAVAGPRPDLRLMLCMVCGDPYAPEQTDSAIGQHWIFGDSSRWETFVSHLVTDIQQLRRRCHSRHCMRAQNPSDLLTLGEPALALTRKTISWT
ncbi:hypothetical protein HPB48_012145 [Haemaphysalis longicornis]|uniref:PG1 pseudoGTPase domain-containing protein n=1 Tax=Haemaphysalis longicornis TaxID=44386 RepID=A0A9J6G1H7_HAELO|nr:hypothetical protein HPB48_012145 [Haemaphysalis longicornis]